MKIQEKVSKGMTREIHLPQVISLNISKGGIPKRPVDTVYIHDGGLHGDGHNHVKHYRPAQAVSLQDMEMLKKINEEGYSLMPGMTGENIDVLGVDVNTLPVGARLIFDNGVQIEITRKRPPCYVLDSIDPRLKKAMVGRCGVYAKVLHPGWVSVGEKITTKIYRELEMQVEPASIVAAENGLLCRTYCRNGFERRAFSSQ